MKFRRKSGDAPAEVPSDEAEIAPGDAETSTGPWDADDLPAAHQDVQRVDLGSLLLGEVDGLELRLQVDEAEERLDAVLFAGPDGAVELRAFAAPRHGDLWADVRPQIAAEYAQRGGTATEQEGRFGPELVCQLTVRTEDGRTASQPSRVIGINGDRWMLRATLLGRPAIEPDAADAYEAAIESVVVRRGAQAMPVGSELPLRMPPREQLTRR